MSGRTPRAEYLAALFIAVTWGAVSFAVFGLLAVVLDREPVEADVAPYYGLGALALAGVVVWLAVARTPLAASPWPLAVLAAAGVYLAMVGWAALAGLPLLVEQASSPFVLAAAALAGLTVVGGWAGLRRWGSAAGGGSAEQERNGRDYPR